MANGTKTSKSASPKVNAKAAKTPEQRAATVARRMLNTNVSVDTNIPIPPKAARSKYPFEALVFKGMSFRLEDCRAGNAAAIKTTAKSKFNMKLMARPEGDGYRFWRMDGLTQAEAAAAEAEAAKGGDHQKAA